MPYGYFTGYFTYRLQYLLFMLPALALVLGAQALVKHRYRRYSNVGNRAGLTGQEAAARILASRGVGVRIALINGRLRDNYNPKDRTLYLSEEVYYGSSVAAVGIAAHEAGHALQDAEAYAPLRFRLALVTPCNIGSAIGIPMAVLGAVLAFDWLMYLGLVLFSLALLFQLVTLPVEFDASRRAMAEIRGLDLLEADEAVGARKVLTAAALTYLAALAQTLMTLLFYVSSLTGRRRR